MDDRTPSSGKTPRKRDRWAAPERSTRNTTRGISLGGIIVIIGIILALFVSLVLGIAVLLIGLIAFGGFVRGRRY